MPTTQPHNSTPQLGYFLDYRYWDNAFLLSEYQLSLKPKNKHFNTLSMFYYEALGDKIRASLREKEYFATRVSNNLLYGLEREYAIHSYAVPKPNLGLRKYRFFTYPMRIAYYAVGLYLLHLSQDFFTHYYQKSKHIHSNYGGHLSFNEETRDLVLSYNSVWYKSHYQRFRNKVRKETDGNVQHKVVFHLDIQNYFEEISIPTLLRLLTECVKPSIQK